MTVRDSRSTLSHTAHMELWNVKHHELSTPPQQRAAFDVLIPQGYIDAHGTWKLTTKGERALAAFLKTSEGSWLRKPQRDSRRTPKARAMQELKRAWIQHHKGGSQYAAHGGQRIHAAMEAAFRAGMTEAEMNRIMDEAAKETERHRGERYRKSVAKRQAEHRDLSSAFRHTKKKLTAPFRRAALKGRLEARAKKSARERANEVSEALQAQGMRPSEAYYHAFKHLESPQKMAESLSYMREYEEMMAHRHPKRDVLKPCPRGTHIQSVILDKKFFDTRDAAGWVRRHGFHVTKIDRTAHHYRFRQVDPSHFEPHSFRTMTLRPGVQAVIGCPR